MSVMPDYDTRQIPVRLLGYSMAISEALKFSIPSIRFLSICRGITVGYAIFDLIHKTREAKKQGPIPTIITATDVFLWQASASIILPTIAVNQLCWVTRFLLRNLKASTADIYTSCIGVAVLPSLIEPFDYFTDYVLDATFRKYVKKS